MRISEYAQRLIDLAETVVRWVAQLSELDCARREKAALYAEEIAATLARAAAALASLEKRPGDAPAILTATRELGRISGYVETILAALETHLDGKKRAGIKRRLDTLEPLDLEAAVTARGAFQHARRLSSAEGFFRALADALRA